MGKMSLAGTSLVAAIPGGVLAYLTLMAVLNHLDPMPTLLKVAAISLLVVSGIITLFPFFILIYGPRSPEAEARAKAKKDAKSAKAAPAAVAAGAGAAAVGTGFGDESLAEPVAFEDSGVFEEAAEVEDVEPFEADDEAFEADGFADTEDEVEAGDYEDEFEFDEFEDDDKK